MSDVTVIREASPLARETWSYRYDDRERVLHLVDYKSETLPSLRHRNWITVKQWCWYARKSENTMAKPIVRSDIDAEALATFRASISVVPVKP